MTYRTNAHAVAQLTATRFALPFADALVLVRAARTLHRWYELECGAGDGYGSWCIERDEGTDLPYLVTYPHTGSSRRQRIPDRERRAEERIARICRNRGLAWHLQTDPRGWPLYISRDVPLTHADYTRGYAIPLDV